MKPPNSLPRRAFGLLALASLLFATLSHAEDGVSETNITIDQTSALSGPTSALALPFHQGAKLYFDRINAHRAP